MTTTAHRRPVTLDAPPSVLAGTPVVLSGTVDRDVAGTVDGTVDADPVRVHVADSAGRVVVSGPARTDDDRWHFEVPGTLPADDYTVEVVTAAGATDTVAHGALHVVGIAGTATTVAARPADEQPADEPADGPADEVLVDLQATYHGPDHANALVESPWEGGLVYEDLHDGDPIAVPLRTHCRRIEAGEIPVDLWVTLDGDRHHVAAALPYAAGDPRTLWQARRVPALPSSTPALVLLDLDGTLTDSAPGIMGSMRWALAEAGLPAPDDEVLRGIVGPPLQDSLALVGVPAERIDELIGLYRQKFAAGGMFDNSVYAGVPEALTALRSAGARLVVATSKPEVFAREIARHFGLDRFLDGGVDGVFGADADGGARSTKAAVVGHALASVRERLAAAGEPMPGPDATVMVGDREHDVLGAGEHGLATVGVRWGYAAPGELEDAGARAVVETPDALVDLLVRRR